MSALFPSAPDYAPYKAGPFRLTLGLAPLDVRDWIEPDARMVRELAEKERLLHERHDEVFAALPEASAGSVELLEMLADYLPSRFPTLYRRVGDRLDHRLTGRSWHVTRHGMHPLDVAGRLVQEDLCLMHQAPGADTYRLVGASLCFPTRWRLAEKLGRSVGAIHAPVPDYDRHLDATMNRLFARLKTERPVWRLNWGLVDDPTLFQPTGHGQGGYNPAITATNAGDMLWVRMERQTLRRLPRTGDVLFTIRVHVHPLHTLATQPERAARLAAALRALPPAMQTYKSLTPFLDAVLAWLDRVGSTQA
jgi:hypothetical protein